MWLGIELARADFGIFLLYFGFLDEVALDLLD